MTGVTAGAADPLKETRSVVLTPPSVQASWGVHRLAAFEVYEVSWLGQQEGATDCPTIWEIADAQVISTEMPACNGG
jgi:hypothetical protein